jgi:hypothetical protein
VAEVADFFNFMGNFEKGNMFLGNLKRIYEILYKVAKLCHFCHNPHGCWKNSAKSLP